jgi:ankyrin repeat protein
MDADGRHSSDTDDNSEPDEEFGGDGDSDGEGDSGSGDEYDDADDYNGEDKDVGMTALWKACHIGDETAVKRLFLPDANGVLPVSCGWIELECDGKTPLLAAVCQGHDRIVQILLKAGASVKAKFGFNGAKGTLPQEIAASRAGKGFTGLMICAMHGQTNMMRDLLEHDSSLIDLRSGRGFTSMEYAIARNHIEMVFMLLKYGADVNLKGGRNGQTPLFMATNEDRIEMVEILLAHGANPIQEDDFGETALTGSVWRQRVDTVQMVITAGCDMNHQNTKRVTALHMCAKWNLIVMAEYLLKRGASIDIKAKSGRTASDTAEMYGNVVISDLIKAEGVRRAQREAFCMGLAHRLGGNSRVRFLDEGVVRMISDYV